MDKRRGRLLIVEDELLLAWVAREALGQAGFEIVGVADGRASAVATALAERPDLVLLDIDLAFDAQRRDGWDGVTAACEIYDKAGIRSLLTGQLDAARQVRALTARPVGVLGKPYRSMELVAAVDMALARNSRGAVFGPRASTRAS